MTIYAIVLVKYELYVLSFYIRYNFLRILVQFNNFFSLLWNDVTLFAATTISGRWLYTQINPRMLRRLFSRNPLFRRSISCLPWGLEPLRVIDSCVCEIFKNSLAFIGPFPRTYQWIIPSIAMSPLHAKGARLNANMAPPAVIQSSVRNCPWKLFSGCKILSHEWYVAAVRHSPNDSNFALYSWVISASLKKRIAPCFHVALVAISVTASFIRNALSKGTPSTWTL